MAPKPGATSAFTPAGKLNAAHWTVTLPRRERDRQTPHAWQELGRCRVPEEGGDKKPTLVFHSRLTPGILTCSSTGEGNSIVENGAEDNRDPQGFASILREEPAAVAGGGVACKDRTSRPSPTTFYFVRSNPLTPTGPPIPSLQHGDERYASLPNAEKVLLLWTAPRTPSPSPEPEATPTTHVQPEQPRQTPSSRRAQEGQGGAASWGTAKG